MSRPCDCAIWVSFFCGVWIVMVSRVLAGSSVTLLCLAAIILAFNGGRTAKAAEDNPSHGYDLNNLDKTCKPCDDFFQFANGGWLKSSPIPAEYPVWGSFVTLADKNQTALREILEAAANASAAPGSTEQKIGDFYASCMDTKTIETQVLKPLHAELSAIDSVHERASLLETVAHLQTSGTGSLFSFVSDQDFKDSSKVISEANQGGLGLPDRDDYTRDDADSNKLHEQYTQHVAK